MKATPFRRKLTAFIESLEARIAPATFTWNVASPSGAEWTNPANWVKTGTGASTFPSAVDDVAVFNSTTGSGSVNIGADITVGQIQFTDSGDLVINRSAGAVLTMNGAGSAEGTITHNGAGQLRFSVPLTTTNGVTFDVRSSGELQYNGILQGAAGFGGYTKTGSGTMSLTGPNANTFSNTPGNGDGFVVEDGTLRLEKANGGALSAPFRVDVNCTLIVGTGDGVEQINDGLRATIDGTLVLGNATEGFGRLLGFGFVNLAGKTLVLGASGSGAASTFDGFFTGSGTIDLRGDGTTPAGLFTFGGGTSTNFVATLNFIGGTVDYAGFGTGYTLNLNGTGISGDGGTGSVKQTEGGTPGILSPGANSIATVSYGSFALAGDLAGGATTPLNVNFQLNGTTPGVNADQIVFFGTGTLLGNVNANFGVNTAAYANTLPGTTFTIVDVQNATPTPFNNLPEGTQVSSLGNGFALAISYVGGDGNDVVLRVVPDLTGIAVLAPTFLAANGRTATFIDTDGDLITVTTNRGAFTAANFLYRGVVGGTGGIIESIDLTAGANPAAFKNATITVKAAKSQTGDGFVNIGHVNATGIDLTRVTVPGDLGQIDAGDAIAKTRGLGTLSVHSLGAFAFGTQRTPFANAEDFVTSSITGRLSTLYARVGKSGNPSNFGIVQGFLDVNGGANPTDAKFGSIGRIFTDQIAAGVIPTVQDGAGNVSFASGTVRASGAIGRVTIEQDITGGPGAYSGDVWSRTSIAYVKVGGSTGNGNVFGGAGFDSGAIFAGSPDNPALPNAGRVATVILKGSLVGGGAVNSGTIYADGGLGNITIGGSVIGGPNAASGAIVSALGIGTVRITGNLTGNVAPLSGSIVAFGGNVTSISVTGSMQNAAAGPITGVFVDGTLGKLTAGRMESAGAAFGVVSALGKVNTKTGALLPGNAITSVTVKGDVTGWAITAGFDDLFDVTNTNGAARKNADAGIGTITITGNVTNTFITAGTLWGGANILPGTGDEAHMPGDLLPRNIAAIAKVTISGQTTNAVIEAEKITALTVGGVKAALTTGVDNPPIANIPGAIIVEIV